MSEAARELATYEDVLNAPDHMVAEVMDHMVAEVLRGSLSRMPRPRPAHARTSSAGERYGFELDPAGRVVKETRQDLFLVRPDGFVDVHFDRDGLGLESRRSFRNGDIAHLESLASWEFASTRDGCS